MGGPASRLCGLVRWKGIRRGSRFRLRMVRLAGPGLCRRFLLAELFARSTGHGDFAQVGNLRHAVAIQQRRADEGTEERVRLEGLGFELGMELASQEPRVIAQLADFYVHAIRGLAGEAQTVLFEHGFILAIELIAVAMSFADLGRSVARASVAVFGEQARICA